GAERDSDERLGFPSRKQGGAVGARQDAHARRDRAHGARVAAIDARLAVEDLAANDRRLEVEGNFLDVVALGPALLADADRFEDALPDRVDRFRARLFLLDAERFAQIRFGQLLDARDERLVL